MRTRILDAKITYFHRPFQKPLLLSRGPISEITEARAEVTVQVNGREATGRGAIFLSDVWAWHDPTLTHEQKDTAMRALCDEIAANLSELCGGEPAHPLELGLRLHKSVCHQIKSPVSPLLARSVCASPFDAAIHDATGIALEQSAFEFYKEPVPIPSGDSLFADRNAWAAIAQTLQSPRPTLDAWVIVGAKDSLEKEIKPWVRERRFRCAKLKLTGKENAADVARTIEVYRTMQAWGVPRPRLSVDSNEGNPDAESVLDYLERLRATDPEVFDALEYLEQPTSRESHEHDWHPVARLKPVIMDEGLSDFEHLDEGVEKGWSGFALKTCKGHSFSLVVAAWARQHNLLLAMQDLTNPGLAAIHSALFAAHLPVINGIELNSPQFTPAANAEWLPHLRELFEPNDGVHHLPLPIPPGLGSIL